MTKNRIVSLAEEFVRENHHNYISEDIALNPKCTGIKIYEAPIFAFGSVDDELYIKYKSFDVIGSHFLSPSEWMQSAKTVISFFLPYTEKIRIANSASFNWPADEWLHGRYEGHNLLKALLQHLLETLIKAGYESMVPSIDPRYEVGNAGQNNKYASNWSERHVAYACGLGTFGLSKGLITKKGMCGRFGSILTELDLPKDIRDYEGVYDYCTMCGICVDRCPVHAISLDDGKNHLPCDDFLDKVRQKHNPRYGCGKCQVSVPCESEIPVK